ncbi:hypothetical protein GF345_05245 [Candidatus Woesearchaeota archaeon]|nr:hypothetical protein [Candidatus Woesearchaeota archaeon]
MAPFNITSFTEASSGLFPKELIRDFSLSGYADAVFPLVLFIAGVLVYSIFIFKFYRLLARRDILKLDLHKHSEKLSGHIKHIALVGLYTIENILLTPVLVIVWVIVLTALLTLMSETHTPQIVLLTAVALVAAVRISAYYNEKLSQDLAKMIPFALLGIFLVDMSFFSLENALETAKAIPMLWKQLFYYLAFVVLLELVMRVAQAIVGIFYPEKAYSRPDDED